MLYRPANTHSKVPADVLYPELSKGPSIKPRTRENMPFHASPTARSSASKMSVSSSFNFISSPSLCPEHKK